jgi:hypothetical protein
MSKKKTNVVDPNIPGAIGSCNSPYLEGRDKVAEAKLIVDETTEKVSILKKKKPAKQKK